MVRFQLSDDVKYFYDIYCWPVFCHWNALHPMLPLKRPLHYLLIVVKIVFQYCKYCCAVFVFVVQIRSNEDKSKTISYSITGPGADQNPVGLFTMDRLSGKLYVTEPLDRETQDRYTVGIFSVTLFRIRQSHRHILSLYLISLQKSLV